MIKSVSLMIFVLFISDVMRAGAYSWYGVWCVCVWWGRYGWRKWL